MESTFDTTAWVMQSLLIMFGVLLVIPLIRAVIGLALISLSAALGLEQSNVRAAGVSLLPAFLRTALGFATVVALTQPQLVNAAEPTTLVIDRVVTSQAAPVTSAPAPTPTPEPAQTQTQTLKTEKPKVIVFDDEDVPSDTVTLADSDEYVVQVGDSLWTIARSLLDDPQPPARNIDRAWRTLWEANRAVIGSDPSLIRPGTRLKLNRDDIRNNIR